MNNIHRLLNDLNKIFPLSAGFWNDLPSMMTEKSKKSGYVFLKAGNVAKKAWQLLSGFIVVIRIDDDGKEIVEKIYYPKQIFTDLNSFFENVPIKARFVAVGNVRVLEIRRKEVLKLEKYPETQKLVQHIIFLDSNAADAKVQMLRLSAIERVKLFLEEYAVEGLPNKYCASLLNLEEEEYIENKISLENSGLLEVKNFVEDDLEDTPYTAYKIKDYLIKNYSNPDIGDTHTISDHFNTTNRTLNRMFIKAFGVTVSKFLLRVRMEKSLELLNGHDLQVGEVALAVGYKNIYHFSKVFKQYYGRSPKSSFYD